VSVFVTECPSGGPWCRSPSPGVGNRPPDELLLQHVPERVVVTVDQALVIDSLLARLPVLPPQPLGAELVVEPVPAGFFSKPIDREKFVEKVSEIPAKPVPTVQ
jgi:hypothetical protein